jgi:uncharacterized protein
MRAARRTVLTLLGLAVLGATAAAAGGLDCSSRWLDRTELAVCDDPQLMRLDGQLARRLSSFATRLNFGQYLGLRHWHTLWAHQRSACGVNRDCIAASYRAQGRFLDRFQRCVSTSFARRACLRDLLAGGRETMRR